MNYMFHAKPHERFKGDSGGAITFETDSDEFYSKIEAYISDCVDAINWRNHLKEHTVIIREKL